MRWINVYAMRKRHQFKRQNLLKHPSITYNRCSGWTICLNSQWASYTEHMIAHNKDTKRAKFMLAIQRQAFTHHRVHEFHPVESSNYMYLIHSLLLPSSSSRHARISFLIACISKTSAQHLTPFHQYSCIPEDMLVLWSPWSSKRNVLNGVRRENNERRKVSKMGLPNRPDPINGSASSVTPPICWSWFTCLNRTPIIQIANRNRKMTAYGDVRNNPTKNISDIININL